MIKDKLDSKLILSGILLFFILVGLNTLSVFIPNLVGEKGGGTLEKIEKNTSEIKQAVNPYQFKDQLNKVIIAQNFDNTTQNGQATQTLSKNLIVTGSFNKGYLFIKASIDNVSLGSRGDVYTKLQATINTVYNEFGGHLISSYSLETPKFNDHSELLYSLSDIKYKNDYRDSDIEVLSGNWLKLFNENGSQQIVAFASTTGQGKIIEFSIYYQCADGSNCSITVQ